MTPDPRPPGRVVDVGAIIRFRLQNMGEPCFRCELRQGVHVHHKMFRSQGGNDHPDNLEWLCFQCHDDIHMGRIPR